MKRPGTTDQLRSILRIAGGPLSIDEIMDALPGVADRACVSSLLLQRKVAGEFTASVIDRKLHYAINPDFQPARFGPNSPRVGHSPVLPSAPSSTRHDVPTGPASVASESPAPLPPSPAVATPRATSATALETSVCIAASALDATPTGAVAARLLRAIADLIDPAGDAP